MDPRELTPAQRKDMRSDLMKAKQAQTTGELVNACPCGCTIDDLDEMGYCRHLIGFTNDGKVFEPMMPPDAGNRRIVQVEFEMVEGKRTPKYLPILKTDKLVRITHSSRVYRNIDKKPATA